MNPIIVTTEIFKENLRLDQLVAEQQKDFSRTRIASEIKAGNILLNERVVKPSHRLNIGDIISFRCEPEKETQEILAEDLPLQILYEDDDMAVINKPAGLTVHPAGSLVSGTLVNALLHRFDNLSDLGGKERQGIVHRLDKDTTGLLIIAKNNEAHRKLVEAFSLRKIHKEYLAVVHGVFREKTATIDLAIARNKKNREKMCVDPEGRPSLTEYIVKSETADYSMLKILLHTGRTHQIRVHLSHFDIPSSAISFTEEKERGPRETPTIACGSWDCSTLGPAFL